MYITLLGIFIITCQYAWPTIFLLIPLAILNVWYRVRVTPLIFSLFCSILFYTWRNKYEHMKIVIYVGFQGYYLATSRELTRLDSITKAPVIHHFSESISGVMTIRCFQKQDQFCQENIRRVNENLRMDFHNNGSNEWLGFRLELLGSFILCLSALFLVLLPSSIVRPGMRLFPNHDH